MKSVAVSEFKSRCLSLLDDVARTGEPLLVTKRGRPLARITPSGNIAVARPQDTLRGSVSYEGDLLAPLTTTMPEGGAAVATLPAGVGRDGQPPSRATKARHVASTPAL